MKRRNGFCQLKTERNGEEDENGMLRLQVEGGKKTLEREREKIV